VLYSASNAVTYKAVVQDEERQPTNKMISRAKSEFHATAQIALFLRILPRLPGSRV